MGGHGGAFVTFDIYDDEMRGVGDFRDAQSERERTMRWQWMMGELKGVDGREGGVFVGDAERV